MRTLCTFSACFALLTITAFGQDELLDRLDEALTVSAFQDEVRLRLSGTIDLEYYHFEGLPIGLVDTTDKNLFNPRLTFFLDAQLGPKVYAFVQARADRGFDPSDGTAEVRLDEYALRYTPWEDGRLSVQIGKFAAVVGNWMGRHLSWDNPFITAPLPYEEVTEISETEVPVSARSFARQERLDPREKYDHDPIIWGPSYATGISVAGRLGKIEYAAEIKNAALASRPESWDVTEVGFEHPTFNARLGYRPNLAWNFGFSGSAGSYLHPEAFNTRRGYRPNPAWSSGYSGSGAGSYQHREAEPLLPRGRDAGDYQQFVLGQDISFAWRHLQVWVEFYEARFEVPRVGNADTFAYYVEAKYKFAPQLFGAIRWNQQLFASVPDGYGGSAPWGGDVWRIDTALGYRVSAHAQLKLQYSVQHEEFAGNDLDHTMAAQFTLRF